MASRSRSRSGAKIVGGMLPLLLIVACASQLPSGVDPGPPRTASNPPEEDFAASGDPLASDSLTFEDIAGRLEPGIELSDAPWDPWNDLSATWSEIFSPESRAIPSQPYIARNFEAVKFSQTASGGAGTLGLIDPTAFCTDRSSECIGSDDSGGVGTGHGHRMALNALHEYPDAGVQAISYEAFFVPFLGEVDGRYQAMSSQLGIDALTNSRLYAISSFALQESDRAKVMVVASGRRWEFNDTDGLWNGLPFGDLEENREIAASQGPAFLRGYEWLMRGEDSITVDTADYGEWTINRASYEWAQWWGENASSHNTLLVSSNQNYFADESGNMVDCFPNSGGLTPDLDQLCGITDTTIAVTGEGLANTLFVCAFDPSQSAVVGNHSGPFAENTIYASGAVYGDTTSCSQATPIVGAIAQKVIDANPSLDAAQVKQILLESADRRAAYRTISVTGGVSNNVAESVRIVNSQRAVQCAQSLECLR